jgi:hypothetical protein
VSEPATVERFRVSRGSIRDLRRVIAYFFGALVVTAFTATALLAAGAPPVVGAGSFLAVMLALFVYLNLPGYVLIGADGVHVDVREGPRFVPFAEIRRIEPYAESVMGKRMIGVVLDLIGEGDVKIPLGEDQFGAADRVEKLTARLRAAHDRFASTVQSALEPQLASEGRTAAEWADALRRIGEGAAAGPRVAAVPAEKLWRIVEDPRASALDRAGAATALRSSLDAPGRSRIRIAAKASVNTKLRVSLEAAAAEDEAGLVDALGALKKEMRREP